MILGIPVYDGVDVLDVTGPFEMLSWAGFEVQIAAAVAGPVRCRGEGMSIIAKYDFKSAPQYDVIWVPGGEPYALACLTYGMDQTYLDFVKRQAAKSAYVCSVCEGALLLAAAGLLDGYTVTTHWAFEICLRERYRNVTLAQGHPRYVWDRNRLTGGGISSGLDEALALIERVFGTAVAQDTQRTTQYYPDPPVTSEMLPPPKSCVVPSGKPPGCA
ncbi:MAG: DJ-1/PfpI family protein [Alphaproteobacteria bacterium]|nr:DJ-1/PfpI family protein [Alphaproteobacteria bacterium]MBV9692453.1 DJ-1/PfpI family protein [Alphaproteobacteria bacterium]